MKRLVLASVASALVIGIAIAQQSAPMPGMDMKSGMDMKMMVPNPSDSASTKGYKAAMMKMMEGMPMMKLTGDADLDFMSKMRTHHQGAIDMAKVVLANGKDPAVKKLAQDIVTAQEKEIVAINAWLTAQGTLSNCHPPSSGAPAWDSQAVEKSAILPSAGGDTTSAAPTVQRHGLPVEVRSDCPPESNAPKAGKPNG